MRARVVLGAVVVALMTVTGVAVGWASQVDPPAPEQATLVARGGVGSVAVEGTPGLPVSLRRPGSATVVDSDQLDDFGGALFPKARRDPGVYAASLDPGLYEVWADRGEGPTYAATVVVRTDSADPYGSQDLIQQSDPVDGSPTARYGYLATRDGTLLSYYLQLPTGPDGCADGGALVACHVPTLLEYSVYDPSNPVELPDTRRDGQAELARGYALLSVNARGTGCSGGVLSPTLLSRQEGLDGYDIVETLAAQSFSTGRVGMTGTSYPGMAQVVVAATNPPHLAAITPGAVLGSAYQQAYPGGVPSNHFDFWGAVELKLNNANPATPIDTKLGWLAGLPGFDTATARVLAHADEGQDWITHRVVDSHDHTCASNTAGRNSNFDVKQAVDDHPLLGTSNDPWATMSFRRLLAQVHVPTLLVDGLGDELEQPGFDELFDPNSTEGGDPAALGQDAAHPGSLIRVVTGDGHHQLSMTREGTVERETFLDLLVAHRVPGVDGATPVLDGSASGRGCLPVYLDTATPPTTLEDATAALFAGDPVVMYWDNTYQDGDAVFGGGVPAPTREPTDACHTSRFRSVATAWPLAPTTESWWLDAAAGLTKGQTPPATQTPASYENVPRGGPVPGTLFSPGLTLPPNGDAAVLTSSPTASTAAYAGPASADLWVTSDRPVVDLEVSIVDVAPDGSETVIRTGWRRTCIPSAAPDSNPLQPRLDLSDGPCDGDLAVPADCSAAVCLSDTQPTLVRVAIPSFTYLLRDEHRLRLRISAPGYAAPAYPFDHVVSGGTVHVLVGGDHPSALVLPTSAAPDAIGNENIDDAPDCGTLRGHLCVAPTITAVTAGSGVGGAVHVDWNTSGSYPWVTHYAVYRDDEATAVATVPATESSVYSVDVTVPDDAQTHTFTVAPVSWSGNAADTKAWLPSATSNEVTYHSDAGTPGTNVIAEPQRTNEGALAWTNLATGGSIDITTTGHDSAHGVEWTPGTAGALPAVATPGTTMEDIKDVQGADVYHAQVWLHGGQDATVAALEILWWNGDGNLMFTSSTSVALAADQDWTSVELNVSKPAGAVLAVPALASFDSGLHAFIADDLTFCEGRATCSL